MTLKYPKELTEANVDYVVFQAHEYRTNANGGEGPPKGEPIILYMPPSTPAVGNMNAWNMESAEGPLGALTRGLAVGAADVINSVGTSDMNSVISDITERVKNSTSSIPGAARQMGLNVVAGLANTRASSLLALSKGKIFNPNIEMIYTGPQLRAFTFDFVFAPKSADEAQIVNRIIKEFKTWSSPNPDGGMFEVPCVWQVTYMNGGSDNNNMNKFKKSALTGISIQDNSSVEIHMSYPDGVPITTSMNLQFSEVDIITRPDHDKGNRGY
jgi:hypothetical protein